MRNVKIKITFSDGTEREYIACAENSIHLMNGGKCILEFMLPESGNEYFILSKTGNSND